MRKRRNQGGTASSASAGCYSSLAGQMQIEGVKQQSSRRRQLAQQATAEPQVQVLNTTLWLDCISERCIVMQVRTCLDGGRRRTGCQVSRDLHLPAAADAALQLRSVL